MLVLEHIVELLELLFVVRWLLIGAGSSLLGPVLFIIIIHFYLFVFLVLLHLLLLMVGVLSQAVVVNGVGLYMSVKALTGFLLLSIEFLVSLLLQ